MLVLSHPGAVVALFWPVMVLQVGWAFRDPVKIMAGTSAMVLFTLTLLVLQLVFESIAYVRWHRWCVLGEAPSQPRFSFGSRERSYLYYWIEILLWMIGYFAIIILPVFFVILVLPAAAVLAANPVILMLLVALSSVVAARQLGLYALKLVAIAIDEAERGRAIASAHRDLKQHFPWFWQTIAAILIGTVVLGDLIGTLFDVWGNPTLAVIGHIGSGVISVFGYVVFATALSLHYREHFFKVNNDPARPSEPKA